MGIEVNEILAKKILTEAKGYLDVGFTHSLNPYSGCAFSCRYCYVREMPIQKFKEIPWGEWLDIKANAAENYRNEIRKLREKNKPVNIFMSSVTDPYQPIERKAKITRSILEEMIENPPDFLQIQTRSPLITRDIDLLKKLNEICEVLVSITIETDREDMKTIFSSYAPGIKLRIIALKEIHNAGISTQASISPVLPFTPDFPEVLIGIVDHIWIDTLSIGDGSMGKRSERLGMPELFQQHELSKWYRKDLHLMVGKYFNKYFPTEMIRISKKEAFPK
ncbi:radical SAM protein [Domibacillus sp. DTU_2020_1001157_1_SI_ALB_TIR_016]|uniref:SPL family radical SAM protein n=1 Tax=Domibacillus sp. DTU_2020_1001157_1_SI_ALB_TIR_016 TaxID=3077789 RepID=UPI0028EC96ED|nr:radical SAM protein [Domibacillus sp. DTU_2020_1001157_1_SI_ALB_TIR_016]WNS78007.1 radical SAM protein [Domibacillus sp. DTU_2020_1001157_1_SI_ALB_TIR_016]